MANKNTSRETKAQELIESGAVTLLVGTRTAEVRGSRGETYTVTHEACTCKDFERRGVDCKHRIACRLLCEEYRRCKAAAERGETIDKDAARELVYGMPYEEWKAKHQD